jgi:uncharacterized membrane protein YeaQ/YmgE (transglycosylase-associated protein family)
VNIVVWLVIGGLIGWVASVSMRTDSRQGFILNVVVGIAGAALGGWLFGSAVSTSSANQAILSIGGQIVSLLGAIILITIVKVFRGAPVR